MERIRQLIKKIRIWLCEFIGPGNVVYLEAQKIKLVTDHKIKPTPKAAPSEPVVDESTFIDTEESYKLGEKEGVEPHPDRWLANYPEAPRKKEFKHVVMNNQTIKSLLGHINKKAKFTKYYLETIRYDLKELGLLNRANRSSWTLDSRLPNAVAEKIYKRILTYDYDQDYMQRLSRYFEKHLKEDIRDYNSIHKMVDRAYYLIRDKRYLEKHSPELHEHTMLRFAEELDTPIMYYGDGTTARGMISYILPEAHSAVLERYINYYTTYNRDRDG